MVQGPNKNPHSITPLPSCEEQPSSDVLLLSESMLTDLHCSYRGYFIFLLCISFAVISLDTCPLTG